MGFAFAIYLGFYDASLLFPDFTISVYSSSCNVLFFGLILSSFLSLSISLHPICLRDAITYKGKEKERE